MLVLNGNTLGVTDLEGNPVTDESFLLIINASPDGVEFTLPKPLKESPWVGVLDTNNIEDPFQHCTFGEKVILGGRSMRVFRDGAKPVEECSSEGE